jgi:hypothetical protein
VIRELGLPFTADYSERILSHSLALIAAGLANSGTTSTTADWTTSLGCAVDAINTYTRRACPPGSRRSAPSGPGSDFPAWKYEPKAPTHERPVVDGEAHSTVKPLDLIRWLCRLITPPGGTILDMFAGSGTTGEACVVEGFRAVLVEREPAYLPLIVARLSKPIQPDLFGGVA